MDFLMSSGTGMDIKKGFYNITIKREPIEPTEEPVEDTQEDYEIEINNHEIKQEIVDDYEEYDEFSEMVKNVIVKEEVILPDVDSEVNNHIEPMIITEPESPPILENGEIKIDPPQVSILKQKNHEPLKFISIKRPFTIMKNSAIATSKQSNPILPQTDHDFTRNVTRLKNHVLPQGNHEEVQIIKLQNHEELKFWKQNHVDMKLIQPNVPGFEGNNEVEIKLVKGNIAQKKQEELKRMNPHLAHTNLVEIKLIKPNNQTQADKINFLQLPKGMKMIHATSPGLVSVADPTNSVLKPSNPGKIKLVRAGNEVEVKNNHEVIKANDKLQYSIQRESQLGLPHECYDCNDCKTRTQRMRRYQLAAKFSCYKCNTRFITGERYAMHMKKHEEEEKPTKDVLKVYPTVKMYGCMKCPKMCATMEALTMHAYIHNKCKICNKRFESTQELEKHKPVHLQLFKCKDCGMTFDAQSYLDNHRDSWHENYQDCKICKRKILKTQMQAHFVQCIMPKEIGCKLCKRRFKTALDLSNHVCPKNQEKSFDFDNLVNTAVSSSGVKVYECGLCRKQFRLLQLLKSHLKDHENMSEFKCGNCEVKFESQKDLDDHLCKTEEEDEFSLEDLKKYLVPYNGVKVYACVVCKKKFYTALSFKNHLSKHSQNKRELLEMKKEVEATNEPFECVQCKSKFSSDEALKLHIRFHYDKPPYKCNKCGKKNFTLASLRSHLIKCSQAKFFDCSECKEIFVEEKHLESHFTNCHSSTLEKLKGEVEVNVESPTISTSNLSSCHKCKIYFMGKTQLENHLKNDHKTNPWYKCESCRKVFKTSLGFEKHKVLHTDVKAFECEVCPDKFHTRQGLTFHMLVHSKSSTIKCWQCSMKFPSEYKLMMHSKSAHPNSKCFKCDECERMFVSIQGFENHKLKCTGVSNFECSQCGKVLTSQQCYNKHLEKHNCRFECPECDKKFMSKMSLRNHLSIHSGEKIFRCSICGKSFNHERSLQLHIPFHDLPYECDHCKKKFLRKVKLIRHMSVHTQMENSKCEYCGERFAIDDMKEHITAQHSGEKPLDCYKCDLKFLGKLKLNQHIKTHFTGAFKCKKCDNEFESGSLYVSHVCYFNCYQCKKAFKSKACLKNHYAKIHPKLKPFECSACAKRFAYKYMLISHFNFHALRKNFKCYVCKSQFRFKSSLTTHLMSHGLASLYKCDACKRKFFTKSELSEHFSNRHLNVKKTKGNSGSGFKCKCGIKFGSKDRYKKHLAVHSHEKLFECNECKKKFAFKVGLESHMLNHYGGNKHVKRS